ncbi:MAG: SHOCT domain-containing protein [Bacilli bacterium]|nr:SHOCT domain-containing protein [Bacilli bacterium]
MHRAIYEKGVITKAEFDKRVREIDSRTVNRPIPQTQQVQVSTPKPTKGDFSLSEDEIADLIKKYKRLLDDGAITLEEYNQKKQELLDLK